jgi:hypothetical protein
MSRTVSIDRLIKTQDWSEKTQSSLNGNIDRDLFDRLKNENPYVVLSTLAAVLDTDDARIWNWSDEQATVVQNAMRALALQVSKWEGAL